jgi:hypothetical protein
MQSQDTNRAGSANESRAALSHYAPSMFLPRPHTLVDRSLSGLAHLIGRHHLREIPEDQAEPATLLGL